MSVIIKEVLTRSDLKKFVQFGADLYKKSPYFCPPLAFDELNTLDRKKNSAFEVCEAIYYLAYDDNKIVGRIAGIVNHRANKAWGVKNTRFGWFDFIDDMDVSRSLLKAVENWGKLQGMEAINGPVGFTDFDHEGLLIDGFDQMGTLATIYNYPYYITHYEAFGLTKEIDSLEWKIYTPKEVPERMARISALVKEKYNLHYAKVKNHKELIQRFGYTFFDLIDEAYRPLYNYSPLTESQKKYYCDVYFPMLNFDFLSLVLNDKDELIALGVSMPDLTKALQKSRGKLFPFGFIHILKAIKAKKIDVIDLMLIAVRPDYQNKGVNALIFDEQTPYYNKYQVQYSESAPVLETNLKSMANYTYFKTEQHKKRRIYIKPMSL